jgi:hypothetical protein
MSDYKENPERLAKIDKEYKKAPYAEDAPGYLPGETPEEAAHRIAAEGRKDDE